jgi:NADH dehydrogenase [ubiquinone] 1 alpha subcomplex assembly factor 6
MPPKARETFFAIRAFNVEVASIKDGRHRSSWETDSSQQPNEKSTMATHLRMEWWKTAISSMYNDPISPTSKDPNMSKLLSHVLSSQKQNPVVRSLHRAVVEFNLTRRFLERLIESRENDLDSTQFQNIHDLIQYSEDSVSSFLYLSLECCAVRNSDADMVASHVGIGIGIVTAIRSIIPRIALSGEMAIPRDVCEKHSISQPQYLQNLFQNYDGDTVKNNIKVDVNLREAIKEMCHVSMSHLSYARGRQYLVPVEGRLCLLPAVTALHYLSTLEKLDFNILHPDILTHDGLQGRIYLLKNMLKLLRTKYTGIF